MKKDEVIKNVLDRQQGHWQEIFARHKGMFGKDPSYPAQRTASILKACGDRKILELGSGQGRDTIFFALQGFETCALDYSEEGLDTIRREAAASHVSELITVVRHDVRHPLPFDRDSFDCCYSHMLYCMALTTPELEDLSDEIHRVLKPGGLNIYTARNTGDPHYRTGIDRGDGMWEIGGGFIVHFFSRGTIEHLAKGFEVTEVEEFDETGLPKKLFLTVLKKI